MTSGSPRGIGGLPAPSKHRNVVDRSDRLQRSVALYPWYQALYNGFFWMPIFFLYFGQHLPLGQVLALEAIYYAAVVLIEVPSGYFSDRVGRRATLLISSGALCLAYAAFFAGASFAAFAAAQVLLACGIAFNSGTDTALHHDTLAALGRAEEYGEREAIVARNALVAGAVAAAAGGAIGLVGLRWAYGLALLSALGALGLVVAMAEPADVARRDGAHPGALRFDRQIVAVVGQLRRPTLAWLFGFYVLATVLNHVPYEFYQPYLDLVGTGLGMGDKTPLVAGLHMAAAMLAGAWVARRSVALGGRIGTGPTLLIAAAIQTGVIAAMAGFLHPLIVLVIVARGVPRALATAPLNAAVTPRLPQHQRATYLSVQSLAGRLGFACLLAVLSTMGAGAGVDDWATLSDLLWVGAAVGAVGLAGLAAGLTLVELDEP